MTPEQVRAIMQLAEAVRADPARFASFEAALRRHRALQVALLAAGDDAPYATAVLAALLSDAAAAVVAWLQPDVLLDGGPSALTVGDWLAAITAWAQARKDR